MAQRQRREIPDNLDPLVDTLANVVGILVIVIVLTQIELGDALARVSLLDAERSQAERDHAQAVPEITASLAEREAALIRRTDVAASDAIGLAEELLEALDTLPERASPASEADFGRVAELREELAREREAALERERFAEAIREVPRQLVARLPDPELVRGNEAWVLVRYGRVYLVDREKLFEAGKSGIRRILRDGEGRPVRQDEFDAIALYLRKHAVGDGIFRWILKTDPRARVELTWETRDGGIEMTRLKTDPRWRAWLARLSPATDFVSFKVWSDSFETYLAARQSLESVGLRAGWTGYAEDEELVLALRFVPRETPRGPIEVD